MIIYRSQYDACFDVCGTPIKMRTTGGEIKRDEFPYYIEQMLYDNYRNTAFVLNGEIVFDIIEIITRKTRGRKLNRKSERGYFFTDNIEESQKIKTDNKKRIKFILCHP